MGQPTPISRWSRPALGISIAALVLVGGCGGAEIKANQDQLAQQQRELDQLKQQVAALQVQNAGSATPAVTTGACDDTVMREAARKGGERFAANDLPHALEYYSDAASACPQSARAQLNLARTYESLGEATQARVHYQLAAAAQNDADASRQARDALARMH